VTRSATTTAREAAILEFLSRYPITDPRHAQPAELIRRSLKADSGTISTALNRMFKAGKLERRQRWEKVKSPYMQGKMAIRNYWAKIGEVAG